MLQTQIQSSSTQKVIQRLQAEGWVECPRLGFPALAPHPLSDLGAFVLNQLQESGGQMELTDLQFAALIFSVPTHQFEIHPHLPFVLKRLEAEGVVERYQPRSAGTSATQSAGRVQMRAARHRSCG